MNNDSASRPGTNLAVLYVLLVIQSLCAGFFALDAVSDLFGYDDTGSWRDSDAFEYLVSAVLVIGVAVTGWLIKTTINRQKRLDDQIRAASGAFAELLDEHFDQWALTPSERDVALLAIKGLSITEMAQIRETREGTIKTQCNAIYRKAGVNGRPQLISLFVEELMGEGLVMPAR